jgi:hypothetical protein
MEAAVRPPPKLVFAFVALLWPLVDLAKIQPNPLYFPELATSYLLVAFRFFALLVFFDNVENDVFYIA